MSGGEVGTSRCPETSKQDANSGQRSAHQPFRVDPKYARWLLVTSFLIKWVTRVRCYRRTTWEMVLETYHSGPTEQTEKVIKELLPAKSLSPAGSGG